MLVASHHRGLFVGSKTQTLNSVNQMTAARMSRLAVEGLVSAQQTLAMIPIAIRLHASERVHLLLNVALVASFPRPRLPSRIRQRVLANSASQKSLAGALQVVGRAATAFQSH
jgi:hypothetical protein